MSAVSSDVIAFLRWQKLRLHKRKIRGDAASIRAGNIAFVCVAPRRFAISRAYACMERPPPLSIAGRKNNFETTSADIRAKKGDARRGALVKFSVCAAAGP